MHPLPIDDPISFLTESFNQAIGGEDPMQRFATLSTADSQNHPRSRMVTIRHLDNSGIYVSANKQSPKMDQLQQNPNYELLIWWPSLLRQFRINGIYRFLSNILQAEGEKPWRGRVMDWCYQDHPQSEPVKDRKHIFNIFEQKLNQLLQKFGREEEIPRPDTSGYLELVPQVIEFQQIDDQTRIHDRRLFTKNKKGKWHQKFLMP